MSSREEHTFQMYKESQKELNLVVHIDRVGGPKEEMQMDLSIEYYKTIRPLRKYVHQFIQEKEKDSGHAYEYFVFVKGDKQRILYGTGNSQYYEKRELEDIYPGIIDEGMQMPPSYWL